MSCSPFLVVVQKPSLHGAVGRGNVAESYLWWMSLHSRCGTVSASVINYFKSSVFIESIMSQLSCIRIHPCGVSQQFLCCNKYLIHLFLSKCIQARVLLSKRFLFQHFTRSHLGASQYNHSLLVLLLTLMGIKCLAEGYLDGSCWIQSISHLFSLITLSQHFSQHTHLLKLHKLGSYNFHTGFRPSIFQIIPQIRLFLFLFFF